MYLEFLMLLYPQYIISQTILGNMKLMDKLIELVLIIIKYPLAWFCLPLMGLVYVNYTILSSQKDKPDSFNEAVRWLKEDNFGKFYRYLLSQLLNKVSNWIGDTKEVKAHGVFQKEIGYKLRPSNQFFSINPFTRLSYEKLLGLAFIYPIVLFYLFWAITGDIYFAGDSWFDGIFENIPTEQRWRAFFLYFILPIVFFKIILSLNLYTQSILTLIIFGAYIYYDITSNNFNFYISIGLFVLFISSYILGFLFSWFKQRSFYVAHRSIFVFSFALAAISVISLSFKVSNDATSQILVLTGICIASIIFTGANAIIIIIAVVVLNDVAMSDLFGSAQVSSGEESTFLGLYMPMILLGGFLSFIAIIVNAIKTKAVKHNKSYLFWSVYNLSILFIAVSFLSDGAGTNNQTFSTQIILFYLVLPLLNAPLDWFSLGVTRGLLHSIKDQYHTGILAFLYIIVDLIFAIVFLLIIIALLVITVGYLDGLSGTNFLTGTFIGIKENSHGGSYFWLYAVVITTLIPTFVHYILAGAAVTMWLPHNLRHWSTENIDKNYFKLWFGTIYLSVTPIIGILIPLMLLYGLYLIVVSNGHTFVELLLLWGDFIASYFLP